MESRKKAPSGERRRRVLRDDGSASKKSASKSTKKRSAPSKLQLYEADAITSLQPRLTEFVPRRKRMLASCLLVGVSIVTILQGLYLLRVHHLTKLPSVSTTPLHLMGAGTLAAWCGSLLLAFAGLVSLVIFSVRRHKVDDYRGRFGMWLTVALVCLLASADASTGIHALFNAATAQLTGYQPFGWSGSWWALCGGGLGIYLLVRVLVDAWRSRGTVLGLICTVATYVLATLFFHRVARLHTDQQDLMAHTSLLLGGHVLLIFSLLTYARYICREAAGEIGIKTKRKKKKTTENAKKTTSDSEPSRIGSWWSNLSVPAFMKKTSKKAKKPKKKSTVKSADEESSAADAPPAKKQKREQVEFDDTDDDTDERPLGRKTRKQLQRQQRQAA